MVFIGLLMLSTMAIAGAAAFFSVYGLAYTFSGVFWSVVVMGASLEAGKLMAASYLYRYWDKVGKVLKTYLMLGVFALMVLTSTGIFGYLSTGYQQDILPLKQKTEQVQLLEDEKKRALERKKQIDDLLAGASTVQNVNSASGGIDKNAARVLREGTKARESVSKQYKDEQVEVTTRIKELDKQLLELKQDLIKTEAHIGPITYVAKAFNLPSDDATKYLIFLIIFAFDPMAVALTLCVNIALRLREQEQTETEAEQPVVEQPAEHVEEHDTQDPVSPIFEQLTPTLADQPDFEPDLMPHELFVPEQSSESVQQQPSVVEPVEVEEPIEVKVEVEQQLEPEVQSPTAAGPRRRPRTYASLNSEAIANGKISELVNHHRYLKAKVDAQEDLSRDEIWELQAIEEVLRKNGLDMYL